jgi:flagellar operon protein
MTAVPGVGGVPSPSGLPLRTDPVSKPLPDFGSLVRERVIFSQHAQHRMQTRGMVLSPDDAARLGQAMEEAGSRGSKQAAIVLGSDIYIVSPPARTVITSFHPPADGMKVITQVDAVVDVSRASSASLARQGVPQEASGSRPTEGAASAPHWSLVSVPEDKQ